MKRFVHARNLELFRRQLAEAKDEGTRQTLVRLLAEEEAKEPRQPKEGQRKEK